MALQSVPKLCWCHLQNWNMLCNLFIKLCRCHLQNLFWGSFCYVRNLDDLCLQDSVRSQDSVEGNPKGGRTAKAASSKDKWTRCPTHLGSILKMKIWKESALQWLLFQTKRIQNETFLKLLGYVPDGAFFSQLSSSVTKTLGHSHRVMVFIPFWRTLKIFGKLITTKGCIDGICWNHEKSTTCINQ